MDGSDRQDEHGTREPRVRGYGCPWVWLYARTVAPATGEHLESPLFWLMQVRCDALLASPAPALHARGFSLSLLGNVARTVCRQIFTVR